MSHCRLQFSWGLLYRPIKKSHGNVSERKLKGSVTILQSNIRENLTEYDGSHCFPSVSLESVLVKENNLSICQFTWLHRLLLTLLWNVGLGVQIIEQIVCPSILCHDGVNWWVYFRTWSNGGNRVSLLVFSYVLHNEGSLVKFKRTRQSKMSLCKVWVFSFLYSTTVTATDMCVTVPAFKLLCYLIYTYCKFYSNGSYKHTISHRPIVQHRPCSKKLRAEGNRPLVNRVKRPRTCSQKWS